MNGLTKDSPLSDEALELLLGGTIPGGFEDVDGVFVNFKTAPEWAQRLIREGESKIQGHCSRKNVWNPNPQAREIQAMSDTADQLTYDLIRSGWRRWQATVQVRSKEECADAGVRYRPYRFPVRVWRGPNGEVILAKLQIEGKVLPTDCLNCKGTGGVICVQLLGRIWRCSACEGYGAVWS